MSSGRAGRVGVGIVGAGVISGQYLENLTKFPDLDVRFVADHSLPRAEAQAVKFGVPRHGTTEQLLDDAGIEIVVSLTRPEAHVEVALQSLARGKHVWTEKPFALDRDSGASLLSTARSANLRVASAPDTVLGAGSQAVRRALVAGVIGVPLSALAIFQSPGPQTWHPNPEFLFAAGAGPLLDLGPYYITSLVHFFGSVARVTATASKFSDTRTIGSGPRAGSTFPVTVPTNVTALLEFHSGGSAQCVFSFDSGMQRTLLEITGSDGTLVGPDPDRFDGEVTVFGLNEIARTLPGTGSLFGRGSGVLELARALREGRGERASGELAYHILDVMLSIIESAEGNAAVEIASTVAVPPPLEVGWNPAERTL